MRLEIVFALILTVFVTRGIADVPGLRFYLYTKQNPTAPTLISANQNSIASSGFVQNAKTKFLCHGYTSNYEAEFPQATKDAYLTLSTDTNVIVVDWAELCTSQVGFVKASQNAKIVGQEIATLVNFLAANNLVQLNNVHFVGHSLGGQVGAFISANLANGAKLPRVTGLDPARDGFELTVDASQRLDATDADFVDVIDTSGGGVFSTSTTADPPRGTADFYPNGGVKQPGCTILGAEYPRLCSHNRAYKFFAESITSNVGFKSCKCGSWNLYSSGTCNACADNTLMGEPVSIGSSGSYYLKTNAMSPFAKG